MLKRLGNKGISTIFGSILLIILVLTLASILFLALYKYNHSVQGAVKVEEERMQERIVLCRLVTQNLSGTEYVYAIYVNNTGSITSRIRAIYIDNEFLCDPSDRTINSNDTYINAKESLWILLPPGVEYEPEAKMTVATERGIKSVEYEWRLKYGSGSPVSPGITKFYFGPLWLDFNRFYYTECDPKNGSYDPSTWKPGWEIEIGTGSIVWNITVKNVDDRDITINQFSCFTLVPNDEPSERKPWYIEPPEGLLSQFIPVNATVNIIYIWKTPKMKQMNPQSIYTTRCRNKVFLTFFGIFHEHDGTTKPYGQTIPFEAVLCVRTGGFIEISAWPTIILANSTMTSTITAKLYNKFGNPVANANVTFSTTLGTLSSLWAMTDINGIATVTLYPSTTPGIATITATWQGLSQFTTVIINGAPVASFTESAETVYTGEVISFNASESYDPDGSIASYFWDFGDGTNAQGVIVNHAYIDDGVYTVTLTVTDDRSATASAEATKTVLNRPPIASFTESAETVLTDVIIHFNASGSYDPDGSIASYFWNFGDGTDGTGVTVDHSYADNGTYSVTLTVTDNDGATNSTSATKTVSNRPPVASFTESEETVYTGESITFSAFNSYDPDGSIDSYFWDFGDGTNATGVTTSHAYVDDGTYTVTLTVTDDDGATDSANATKTVLNRSPVASFTENATTVFTGEVIHFDASASYDPDGSVVNYFWDFGDGTNETGVTVDHSYADNGTYTVTLTITDDNGATDTANSTKTVLNRLPVASFTESAENVYKGETISFNASASFDPDGIIVNYFWDFGDGTNTTGVTSSHSYSDDGIYTVTLTVTDNDGAVGSTNATKMVLNRPPVASFTENATIVLTGEVIHFNASTSYDQDGSIVSYFWDFGDGANGTGVVVDHSYVDNGTYTVILTITDDDGATDSVNATKYVLNRSPVASFTESAETVYTGEVITFNASDSSDPDGSIVGYTWNFGDGNITAVTTPTITHAYTDNGTYTVTLTVTDDDGAIASSNASKTVLNRPPVANFTESAETVYVGEPITFNATGSYDPDGTIVSYFWDFGDNTNATGVAADHAYADDGVYNVTLTVTDDDGAVNSASAAKTVLNIPPVAFFTENATIVHTGESIRFNASGSYDPDGSITSYFWDFGDGTNATGLIVDHSYTASGNYTVTLTVTDNDGATNSTTAVKTVTDNGATASVAATKTILLNEESE